MKKQSVLKIAILAIIVLATITLLYILHTDVDKDARLETIQQGNQIVHNLEEYFKIHQRYPQNLDEIGPISAPKWGKKWVYECGAQGKTFGLKVGYKDYGDAYYPVMYYGPHGWTYDN